MDEKKTVELVPAIPLPNFPDPILIDETSDILQARKADIQLFNTQLLMLRAMWDSVRTVKTALDLHDRVMEMIPRRRALLGLEYGSSSNKASRQTVFEPVD